VQFDARSDRPVGHVFILPHDRVPSSDAKDRGYVLLNRCAPPEVATLAFRSSKSTERDQFGAPAASLAAAPSVLPVVRLRRGGADDRVAESDSLLYPTRLVSWPSADLVRSSQTVTTLLRTIRQTTWIALGMRTGTHVSAGLGHRGKLLRLSDRGNRVLPFRWGVILTDPQYSAEQRWQVVVPIFRSVSTPLPNDVRIGDQADRESPAPRWLSAINPGWGGAVLSCALICSVSHLDGHVDRLDAATIDQDMLAAVEAQLAIRFNLPGAP
jgi:hypothetical protein